MIINIRYYIIMSTSIFLALGVGIFIGFSLDGQEIFIEQQQGLIAELEGRFLELKQETVMMETMLEDKERELKMHRELAALLIPQLVQDSLKGINIAVIQNGGGLDHIGMENMLTRAGAQVTSTTRLKGGFVHESPQDSIVLRESLDEFVKEEDLCPYICRRLVNAIITGGDKSFVERMKELGIIEVFGAYTGEIDYFILAGEGFAESPDTAAGPGPSIIDAIKRCSIPALGVEESGCARSVIKQYKDAKISSVDNIDSVIGQYSLIRLLQGSVGHYGFKDTAQSLVPGLPGVK